MHGSPNMSPFAMPSKPISHASRILDCQNARTTLVSISQICGVETHDIKSFVQLLDVDKLPEYKHETAWNYFQRKFSCVAKIQDTVWFHGTRCTDLRDFDGGIFPNNVQIARIWENLWGILREYLPYRCSEEFEADALQTEDIRYQIQARCQNGRKRERGPWGVLVRQELCGRHGCGHYILEGSELTRIILRRLGSKLGQDLDRLYREKTKPCIIHFLSGSANDADIGRALIYLRDVMKGVPLRIRNPYGCVSMEGAPVAKSKIISIYYANIKK